MLVLRKWRRVVMREGRLGSGLFWRGPLNPVVQGVDFVLENVETELGLERHVVVDTVSTCFRCFAEASRQEAKRENLVCARLGFKLNFSVLAEDFEPLGCTIATSTEEIGSATVVHKSLSFCRAGAMELDEPADAVCRNACKFEGEIGLAEVDRQGELGDDTSLVEEIVSACQSVCG